MVKTTYVKVYLCSLIPEDVIIIFQSRSTCEGIHSEERKGRKGLLFLSTATTFKKHESGSDFQRIQIWNDREQKHKKNYGSHPILITYYLSTQAVDTPICHIPQTPDPLGGMCVLIESSSPHLTRGRICVKLALLDFL
jgi:hypothetical protein